MQSLLILVSRPSDHRCLVARGYETGCAPIDVETVGSPCYYPSDCSGDALGWRQGLSEEGRDVGEVLREESMRPRVGREVTSLVTGSGVTALQVPRESSSEPVGPE